MYIHVYLKEKVGGVGTVSALLVLSHLVWKQLEKNKNTMKTVPSQVLRFRQNKVFEGMQIGHIFQCVVCVWAQQNLRLFTCQIYTVFLELSVSLLSQLRKRTTASILNCCCIDRMRSLWHKTILIFPNQRLIRYIIRSSP